MKSHIPNSLKHIIFGFSGFLCRLGLYIKPIDLKIIIIFVILFFCFSKISFKKNNTFTKIINVILSIIMIIL